HLPPILRQRDTWSAKVLISGKLTWPGLTGLQTEDTGWYSVAMLTVSKVAESQLTRSPFSISLSRRRLSKTLHIWTLFGIVIVPARGPVAHLLGGEQPPPHVEVGDLPLGQGARELEVVGAAAEVDLGEEVGRGCSRWSSRGPRGRRSAASRP